jgi:hypothetical protein
MTNEQAQQRVAELMAQRGPGHMPHDKFKIEQVDPTDVTKGARVIGRRHDDHTTWERV